MASISSYRVQKFWPVFTVGIMLALSACTTARIYSGEPLSAEKIAIIEGAWNEYVITSVRGHVLKVDGQKAQADKVEVLPGQHEVVVFLSIIGPGSMSSGIPQTFTINVEAGHKYKVDGNWNYADNQIWIEDTASGVVIAGNKPKED